MTLIHSDSIKAPCFEDLLHLPTLVSVAKAIIGDSPLTLQEADVASEYQATVNPSLISMVGEAIDAGTDPLGTAYCVIRSPKERRSSGQTFTPIEAVAGMFAWAESKGAFARIVDPGAGSGRYILHGLRRNLQAVGVAAEMDPLVALILRANAIALNVLNRLEIYVGDYRTLELLPINDRTLFIGNPPYVRHHDIAPEWKNWYSTSLKALGHASSQLAGLHLHFFLKTLALARRGDLGCFITAAEWLDVNYGQSLRELLTNGLGATAVFVVSPEVAVFGDAMVSACITCFAPGSVENQIEFKKISSSEELLDLSGGHFANKNRAKAERSWSILLRNEEIVQNEGFINLGDLFQVKRGQVTGKNSVWVTTENRFGLADEFLVPSITDAADIIHAPNGRIEDLARLKRVVALPASLNNLSEDKLGAIVEFLEWARSQDADKGFVARNRKPWWRVNMSSIPQIVVTYMGRRPPVFAINSAGAGLINVAHGLYPKVELDSNVLERLVDWLNRNVRQDSGRVYAGGLTKFEPSEVMRIQIPSLQFLGDTT